MNREEEGYSSSDGVPLMNYGVPSVNGDEEEVPNISLTASRVITVTLKSQEKKIYLAISTKCM